MMKKFSLVVSIVVLALGVQAADYVWTGGGDEGVWTDSANWGVESGYPVCGDTATFNADATITADFDMGGAEGTDGMLTVVIADGKKLTFDCSVSGNGGLKRQGDGELYLKKANPFKGVFKSEATGYSASKARTYVYNGGALGLNSADFYVANCMTPLTVDAGGGTIEFDIPFSLSWCSNAQSSNVLHFRNGTIIFNQPVKAKSRLSWKDTSDLGGVIRFKDTFTVGGWFDFALETKFKVYFEKGYSVSGSINLYGFRGELHLMTQVTKIDVFYRSQIVSEIEDVLLNSGVKSFNWSNHNNELNGSRFNLNGFTQHYPVLTSGNVMTYSQNYGFTSPADKPANVVLEGAYKNNLSYNGHFYGTAGLVWNPDSADYTFIFTNTVNDTTGEIVASNGTIRLAGTSSFTALTRIEVSETGTFSVDATAGAKLFATNVEVAVGGKLALASGVALTTKKLVIGEQEYVEPGRYTATDYPELIDGEGAVVIQGVPCGWVGADGGRWADPANWDIRAVPGVQNDVTIPGGKKVLVDETTPEVCSLTLGNGSTAATITMSGWDTCLRAKTVTVRNKSSLTIAAPFTNETDKARIWIQCTDFTLETGATIAMNGKGWEGGHYNINSTVTNPGGDWKNCDGVNHGGWGPGRTKNINAGASHLGRGGYSTCNIAFRNDLGAVYDDPYAPVEPGSGGYGLQGSAYGEAYKAIGHGGGAVLIEAKRTVIVDGSIQASGAGSSTHSHYNGGSTADKNNQAGSGGAVLIRCATIAGSGEIHADGGRGGNGLGPAMYVKGGYNSTGMPGGGGGVAIFYDSTQQTADAVAGLKVSAAAGVFYSAASMTFATIDDYFHSSEPGTLYFADTNNLADTKLVDGMLGKGLSGRLFSLTNYTYEGDIDWTYGYVRFGATGAVVNVTGNLTLSGENSRLDLGGNYIRTDRTVIAYVDAGTEPLALNVGGDLTVTDGALLAVYAAQVNDEATEWGAEVSVVGELAVGAGGRIRPVSNYGYGGSPHFTVGSFALEHDGKVDATGCGGAGGASTGTWKWMKSSIDGIGKGASVNGHVGASHGGKGGNTANGGKVDTTAAKEPVDDPYAPRLMGAGSSTSGYSKGGDGGGVFCLKANGPVRVDGEIVADGLHNLVYSTTTYFYCYSSGAGGAICLEGTTFSGAATARLSARGGIASTGQTGVSCGGGGGGRVALWFHNEKDPTRRKARHATSADDPKLEGGFANWLGKIDVGGGTNAVPCSISHTLVEEDIMPGTWGKDGTVTYNGFFDPLGVLLLVR